MKALTCAAALPLLPLMAGDDLEPAVRPAVAAHVKTCAGCAHELAEHRAQLVWFRNEATAPLDGQRLLAFRRDLGLKIAAERKPTPWSSWIRRLAAGLAEMPGRQAVAVAAAFALIVGAQVSRRPDAVVSQPLAATAPGSIAARSTMAHAPLIDDGLGDENQLRIEIQTQDPSVRIIWFGGPSPQN